MLTALPPVAQFQFENDAQTPLVIRRGSKSKVQTYWRFRSCRCILIHTAMVSMGHNGTAGPA